MCDLDAWQLNPSTQHQARLSAEHLKEAAALVGRHYQSLYRAACRGDLKVLSGFGRMMVSVDELDRFLNRSQVYRPTKRRRRRVPEAADLEVALQA